MSLVEVRKRRSRVNLQEPAAKILALCAFTLEICISNHLPSLSLWSLSLESPIYDKLGGLLGLEAIGCKLNHRGGSVERVHMLISANEVASVWISHCYLDGRLKTGGQEQCTQNVIASCYLEMRLASDIQKCLYKQLYWHESIQLSSVLFCLNWEIYTNDFFFLVTQVPT